jgi:FtsP/CotA-like multicopper oxidase with cupredoxin domain
MLTRTTLISFLIAAGFHGLAQEAPPPAALQVAPGETLALRLHASGDQIYSCDGSQWVLSGPDARLTDDAGRAAGTHFAGPTWRLTDGSSVTAKAVANATPDPNSIPWLLLRVTGHEGDGALNGVTAIQRLHTKGGKPATQSCTPDQKNRTVRAPYTADYYFYSARR